MIDLGKAKKCVKLLGLLAVATAVLTALAGTGSASATVLCTENVKPCPPGEDYVAGRQIEMSLEGSMVFRDTGGSFILSTCTSSSLKGKLTSTGGNLAVPVQGAWEAVTFGSCSNPITVLKSGGFDIDYLVETKTQGTLTLKETQLTLKPFGVSCTYGATALVDAGRLTGKTEAGNALSHFSAILLREAGGFLCPGDIVMEAKYVFTDPEDLYFKEYVGEEGP